MTKNVDHFPISFSKLIGQLKAKKMLSRGILSDRLAHGYLFKGPDGVGKRLFGRSLAASVNCRERKDVDGCGRCSSCKKYSSGNHPDFIVIRPEKGTIRINTIREMIKSLSYPPYESSRRVVLLEDIHTMRREASNSLLKTLEEPPEDNLFILTAELSKEIPQTIVSRCQVVPFFNLSIDQTMEILHNADPQMDSGKCRLLSRLSEGSPGRALFFSKTEIVDILEKVVNVISDPTLHADDHVGQVLETAKSMAELSEHLFSFLGLLRIWLRDSLLVAYLLDNKVCVDFVGEGTNRERWKSWRSWQVFNGLSAIDRAEKELNRNCNRALVCEVLLFRLQQELMGTTGTS